MRAKVVVAGHPVHPMLVVLPVGATVVGLVLDLLHAASGDAAWFRSAFVVVAVGAAGALVAIVPGIADFTHLAPLARDARRLAVAHASLGMALTALLGVNAAVHLAALPTPDALAVRIVLALDAVGAAAVAAQVFMGTGLVTAHRFGLEPSDGKPP